MPNLLAIVPSRGRPGNIERLWGAIQATTEGEVDLLVCLDDDDERNYPRLDGVRYDVGPRLRLTGSWNKAAAENSYAYDYFAFLGDDVVPETTGWDTALVGELDGLPFGVAYGDDGIQHENLPTHAVIPSRMVEALGWVALPSTKHLYLDVVWKALGEATGTLRYRPDVLLTHYHRNIGLAPADETYREANDTQQALDDRDAFLAWHNSDAFNWAVDRLKGLR